MKRLKVDLATATKNLRVLTSSLVNTKFIGSYRSVFRGKGLEFRDYRQYTPDDDAASIDWKATVRSKKTLIKEFEEERNLNVFFLVDASSSMLLSSTPKLKSEYAAEIVASLSRAILESGDNVGFALFTDRPMKSVLPDRGTKQFYILSETIVDISLYGGKFDLGEALKFLIGSLSVGTLVMIVSDFITSNNWEQYLQIAARKFGIIGVMIRDPTDRALPKISGRVIVSDPFSNNAMLIEPNLIRERFAKYVKEEERKIKDAFVKNNSDFLELTTDVPFLEPLTKFFKMRELRLR